MKFTISGKQMTVRPSLKEMTEKKFAKFNRFFDDDTEAVVVYSCRHDLQYIEITIRYNATIYRSEEGADTFQTAIDQAIDSLERQIRKNKTKLEKRLLPEDICYKNVLGLSTEAAQKLEKFRPASIGAASRISGVSPADISVLLIYLDIKRKERERAEE